MINKLVVPPLPACFQKPDENGLTTSFAASDIRGLAKQIVTGSGEDRALAIDILVNLAARTDEAGKQAQEVLRNLHKDPHSFGDHEGHGQFQDKSEIREGLVDAAYHMCKLALLPKDSKGKRIEVDHPLSITVAGLGASSAKADADTKRDIQCHVKGPTERMREDGLLDSNRCVSRGELLCAARGIPEVLPVKVDDVLDMSMARSGEELAAVRGPLFIEPISIMAAKLANSPNGSCQAVWVNTGDPAYAHWMTLVLQKAEDGVIHCHVLDTNSGNQVRSEQIKERLTELLATVGLDDDQIHFYPAPMQDYDAPNGCGPLGHRFLKALAEKLSDPESGGAKDAHAVSTFVEQHVAEWIAMTTSDREAAMLNTRTKLLEAWQASPASEPAPGFDERAASSSSHGATVKTNASPASEPTPGLDERVAPSSSHGATVKTNASPASAPAPGLDERVASSSSHGATVKTNASPASAPAPGLDERAASSSSHGATVKRVAAAAAAS